MLSLGNSVISIQLGQDIERSQNNNSPKQNKGLSFLDIKDIVESTVEAETKIEVKLDENNTYLIGKYGPVIKCIEQVDGKEEITFKIIFVLF